MASKPTISKVNYQYRGYLDKDEDLLIAARLPKLLRDYRDARSPDLPDKVWANIRALCDCLIVPLQQNTCLAFPDVKPLLDIISRLGNDSYLVNDLFREALTLIKVLSQKPQELSAAERNLSNSIDQINEYRRKYNLYVWEEAIAVVAQRSLNHIKRQQGPNLNPYRDSFGIHVDLERVDRTSRLEPFELFTYESSKRVQFAAYTFSAESLNIWQGDNKVPLPHYPCLYRVEVECCPNEAGADEENMPSCVMPRERPLEVQVRVGPRYFTHPNGDVLWEPLDLLTERVVVVEVRPLTGGNHRSAPLLINNPYAENVTLPPSDHSGEWRVQVETVLMTELGPVRSNPQSFIIR